MEERIWHRFYEPGVPPSIDYEPLTLPQFLDRAAAAHPDATALFFLNRRLSYRELKEQVDRLATALARLGVERGVRVAIQMPNLPQVVIAYYATLSLGAQVVMTSPLYVPREIEHQWHDAGCTVAIVADYLYEGRVRPIRDRLPVKEYVIASIPEYARFPLSVLLPFRLRRGASPRIARIAPEPGVHPFRRLIRATPPRPPRVSSALDDVAVLQYTGGTTGLPKAAMLTHRNLSCNVQQLRAWFPDMRPGREVMLAVLPYFHSFGMTVGMNFPVCVAAAAVVIPDPRDAAWIAKSLQRHRVTLLPAVPALFTSILSHARDRHLDLTSVKRCFSGSAPLSPELLQRFEAATGGTIAEGFGLTEASPVTHANPLFGQRKVGTIGLPVPDTDAKIVDPADGTTELPPGEEGELILRGPQVMGGYANRPEETAATLRGGWLYTGDLAVMDEEGYFRIVGRKKELIVAAGYKIFPDEVDRVLLAHPAVLEAATIGVPDPRRGEAVKSFVVLRPSARATAEELVAYCRENLASYKVPRRIEFRDELPKSGALKILRRELREQELARMRERGRSV